MKKYLGKKVYFIDQYTYEDFDIEEYTIQRMEVINNGEVFFEAKNLNKATKSFLKEAFGRSVFFSKRAAKRGLKKAKQSPTEIVFDKKTKIKIVVENTKGETTVINTAVNLNQPQSNLLLSLFKNLSNIWSLKATTDDGSTVVDFLPF